MADFNTKTMHTAQTNWVWDSKEEKFYGTCIGCNGEKSKNTPQVLKNRGIKPCDICTDMKTYNSHSQNKGG